MSVFINKEKIISLHTKQKMILQINSKNLEKKIEKLHMGIGTKTREYWNIIRHTENHM